MDFETRLGLVLIIMSCIGLYVILTYGLTLLDQAIDDFTSLSCEEQQEYMKENLVSDGLVQYHIVNCLQITNDELEVTN